MKPIDSLAEEAVDEEDVFANNEEKVPREIGEFIIHESFNEE